MKEMKRNIILMAIISTGLLLGSCGGDVATKDEVKKEKTETSKEEAADVKTLTIDTEKSVVKWQGNMVGVYKHFGTINLKEGQLVLSSGNITAGKFVVDMNTITPTDENYSDEHPASDLVGHLSNSDFFDIPNNPTATFEISGSELASNTISGKLTVRGTTQEETVTDVVVDEANSIITGKLVFNRQTYGAAYKAMQDMVLSDDIELEITLKTVAE
jgi:polyisoprenoid-binding protein YceI